MQRVREFKVIPVVLFIYLLIYLFKVNYGQSTVKVEQLI